MTRAAERLFALVRATLRNRMDDASLFEGTDAAQWREIYDLSSVQGVLAQAWDGMQLLPEAMRPPRALRLQWAVNVERIEKVYRRQERAIARLAAFYREHAIPMMLLKGYGLSLFYPVPEHRPCGDIDIWLSGVSPRPTSWSPGSGAFRSTCTRSTTRRSTSTASWSRIITTLSIRRRTPPTRVSNGCSSSMPRSPASRSPLRA